MSWLMMPWRHKEPGHQWPRYWPNSPGNITVPAIEMLNVSLIILVIWNIDNKISPLCVKELFLHSMYKRPRTSNVICGFYFIRFPVDRSIVYGAMLLDSWGIGAVVSVASPPDCKVNLFFKSHCKTYFVCVTRNALHKKPISIPCNPYLS